MGTRDVSPFVLSLKDCNELSEHFQWFRFQPESKHAGKDADGRVSEPLNTLNSDLTPVFTNRTSGTSFYDLSTNLSTDPSHGLGVKELD